MVEAVAEGARGDAARGGSVRRRRAAGVGVVQCLLASATLSVVIEWAGMTWWWPEEGAGHARRVLETERGYLAADFRSLARQVGGWTDTGYYWAVEWTGLGDALGWAGRQSGVGAYVSAAADVLGVLAARVCVLVLSAPAFVLFGLVGLASGLTLRDIRRWSAGREFGSVYHAGKRWVPRVMALAAMVYLTVPVPVHPTAVIVPGAAGFGGAVMLVAASFKKYL